jgi:hypothetical protein
MLLLFAASAVVARPAVVCSYEGPASQWLEGQTIKAVAFDFPPFAYVNSQAQTFEGHDISIIKEVARRGGFKLELVAGQRFANESQWEDTLARILNDSDLTATWWFTTKSRLDFGYHFSSKVITEGLVVAIPLVKIVEEDLLTKYFTFLQPFTFEVWILIFCTTVAACIFMLFLESMHLGKVTETKASKHSWKKSSARRKACTELLYSSCQATAQVGNFTPKTTGGRIFTVGYAFYVVVLISVYTANLAAYLTETTKSAPSIRTFEEGVVRGYTFCWQSGAQVEVEWLKEEFPHANFEQLSSTEEVLEAVMDPSHSCDAGLDGMSTLQMSIAAIEGHTCR